MHAEQMRQSRGGQLNRVVATSGDLPRPALPNMLRNSASPLRRRAAFVAPHAWGASSHHRETFTVIDVELNPVELMACRKSE